MLVPTIFLDESGNTGANLVDKQQPIFTMAGTNFTKKEANQLLELIDTKSTKEAHFSSLRRRPSGQDAIVRMLKHSLIKPANVKVCLIHKPFMVTTKIVDVLIEHMAFETGFDLYKNGANIALSNMLHYCLPAFCGEVKVELMQKQFIDMVKIRNAESITTFYESIYALKTDCSSEQLFSELDLILATRKFVDDALANIDRTVLDPLIPSLFNQYVEWGKEYPNGFHIIHDDSKTLTSERKIFEEFMTKFNGEDIELGYDRRKFSLPLRGKSLEFGMSHNYPQLQVTDIVASAIRYWADGVSRGEKEDELFKKLDLLDFQKLIISIIWPSLNVTPQSLGTVHCGGINAADGSAYFLMKTRLNSSSASKAVNAE